MRTLTSTLSAAQKSSSRKPCVKLTARNNLSGVRNLKWERLYTGSEMDSGHAITIPGDGSLVRIRNTPASDGRKLYRQRVVNPGPGSDFSQWTYLTYNVMAMAACSLVFEVSLFCVKNDGEIDHYRSWDYGATWYTFYPGYTPTGDVTGMAAAYKSYGDLALFITDTDTLYLFRMVSGEWQERVTWDKTTGPLTGVAAIYDGDWKLLVSGQDADGDYKVWSLIYGDGGEVEEGNWSDLKEIVSAPYEGNFEYKGAFLDKPDVYRCFFVEKFIGSQAYSRPFRSHSLPDTAFLENRWREPVPFDLESEYGLAMAHFGSYGWAAVPAGVWRASLAEKSLELTPDILSVKGDFTQDSERLVIELRNDNGQYATVGAIPCDCPPLDIGCQVDFSPGYVTPAGNEFSYGQSFALQGYEHTSSPGKASLFLYAAGGWEALEIWKARYQLRWNKPDEYGYHTSETCVKEVLAQVLARAGMNLEVISESSAITGFYPDFTIHAGDNGRSAVTRLLSFVPDILFLEGNCAYLVNPLDTDPSVYSYGAAHVILEGRYRSDSWKINRVQVQGLIEEGWVPVSVESFDWDQVEKTGDRLEMIEDLNVDSVAKAEDRGAAYLRQAEIESITSLIRVPANCGQQIYDVIDITDSRAGLAAARRRVLGIALSYNPKKGEYEQILKLGEV